MSVDVEREWRVRKVDRQVVDSLAEALDGPRIVAELLATRDVRDPENALAFLEPSLEDLADPTLLPDMEEAVERVDRAIEGDERILVYADRDVDGCCGCATLVRLLESLGADVDWYVPGKWDGYGLHESAIEDCSAETDLLVTVDCGTTAHDQISLANDLGIDVVVTDHHDPDDGLPPSLACVNPRREESDYPHESVAGGAVAMKLGQALVESRGESVEDYHEYALPLAAIATLGDYMQLNVENRAIAIEGFNRIPESGLPGLIAAADHCDITTVRDLSWSLAPYLNAAQEDESGEAMIDLLLAADGGEIVRLLDALGEWREERRQERKEQQRHLVECLEAQADPAEDRILVVETEQYVGGGPLNQVSEEWGRPILTYRENGGTYRGGGRTDPDVDFLELYAECDDLLAEYWGHPGAAGFETATTAIEDFEQAIREALRAKYEPADLRPTVDIDRRLQPTDVTAELVEAIELLRPFGPGNPEPKFLIECEVADRRLFGDGDCHVALVPASSDSFEITYWNGAEDRVSFQEGATYDFVGTLGVDDYTDQPTLTVDDYQPGEAS